MYLVFSKSPYTGKDMMTYKSLEYCQRFIAGWIRDILVAHQGEIVVVTAKVSFLKFLVLAKHAIQYVFSW